MAPIAKFLAKAPFVVSVQATEYLRASDETLPSNSLLFSDSSPANMFLVSPNTTILQVVVEVQTAFDGLLPTVALGVSGTTNRHVSTNDADLTTIGFYTVPDKLFNYTAAATLIATLVSGGSTVGKLRFWTTYRSFSNK